MKHVTYTCDICGKQTGKAWEGHLAFRPQFGVNPGTVSNDIDLCCSCLNKLKRCFDKKKTASGKEIPEAEA